MEITYFGANCFRVTTKESSLVFDDNLTALKAKPIIKESDVALFTQLRLSSAETEAKLVIDAPGEYELSDVTVFGIQAKAHTDQDDERSATIYRCLYQGLQIVILGHVDAKLSNEMLESIGVVDVLLLPVGGHGYTLDNEEAAAVIKLINPKATIPCHYEQSGITYEVPQGSLDDFLHKVGAGGHEAQKSLKLKAGEVPEGIIILEK